jgi:hypothetical protein
VGVILCSKGLPLPACTSYHSDSTLTSCVTLGKWVHTSVPSSISSSGKENDYVYLTEITARIK